MNIHPMIRAAWLVGSALSLASGAAWATDLPSHLSPPGPPILADIFGAIALSADNRIDGADWGAATPDAAAGRAQKFCEDAGGQACRVVVTMENRSSFWRERHSDYQSDPDQIFSCAAVAVGIDGSRGEARSHRTWAAAEAAALAQCGGEAHSCRIKQHVCT